jgi:hypothetical protein
LPCFLLASLAHNEQRINSLPAIVALVCCITLAQLDSGDESNYYLKDLKSPKSGLYVMELSAYLCVIFICNITETDFNVRTM